MYLILHSQHALTHKLSQWGHEICSNIVPHVTDQDSGMEGHGATSSHYLHVEQFSQNTCHITDYPSFANGGGRISTKDSLAPLNQSPALTHHTNQPLLLTHQAPSNCLTRNASRENRVMTQLLS